MCLELDSSHVQGNDSQAMILSEMAMGECVMGPLGSSWVLLGPAFHHRWFAELTQQLRSRLCDGDGSRGTDVYWEDCWTFVLCLS